jgi:hypothetical protein
MRRQLRAEQARSQDPQRHLGARSRHRFDPLARAHGAQVGLQQHDVLRKPLGGRRVAPERRGRGGIGAGRAAETEIDAPGEQRFERAELLGDHVRRMIGQHDAARADADGPRRARDVRDHDRRGGRGDGGEVVVLGDPEAPVAQRLGVLREPRCFLQRRAPVAALPHAPEFENGHNHVRSVTGARAPRQLRQDLPRRVSPRPAGRTR